MNYVCTGKQKTYYYGHLSQPSHISGTGLVLLLLTLIFKMKIENTKAQMRKGVLEYCILSVLSGGEAYTSDILQALKSARMIVVEGTIYPLLSRLKNAGLLNYRWEESSGGPPRKYYGLTQSGKDFLTELDATWNELNQAVSTITDKHKKDE